MRGDRTALLSSRGLVLEILEWGDVAAAEVVYVAAHGFLDAAAFFAPLAQQLVKAPGVALRALSFAGHAMSDWADIYRWFDHTRDLMTFAEDTRRIAPLATQVLIGHSFGAVQALDAARWLCPPPDAVVNLDAASGPSSGTEAGLLELVRRAAELAGQSRMLRHYASIDAMLDRRLSFNPRLDRSVLAALMPALAKRTEGGWAWRVDPTLSGWARPWQLGWTRSPDPIELMRALPIPTLLVTGGARDHPLVRGEYPDDRAFAGLERTTHRRLPHAGHYVHLECVGEVAMAVADFARLSAA